MGLSWPIQRYYPGVRTERLGKYTTNRSQDRR